MEYELAKKLKEAGFPMKVLPYCPTGLMGDDMGGVVYPTLSELIEACGEKFGTLYRMNKKWLACTTTPIPVNEDYKIGEGSTPYEAVSNLYIALHSKN